MTNYGDLGMKLPYIWGKILSEYAHPTTIIFGLVLYIIIYVYIYHLLSKSSSYFPGSVFFRNLILSGIVIFLFGYAIFYTNNKVGFSPTGIDNRVAIAASLGIACTFVGGFGWLMRLIPSEKVSRFLFSICIAFIGMLGFSVINTEAAFWIKANEQQQMILSDIYNKFPSMEKGSILFLDGVCPYAGPGIVFESQWDLKGALQTHYHEEFIRADIVTPRLQVKKDGIYTQIYTFRERYRYQYPMYIYNFITKEKYPIKDEKTARDYFQVFNPKYSSDCPKSSAGNGVDIF